LESGNFTFEGRDIRDKKVHPATFPISLAKKVIELIFSIKANLILDPFVGSGTSLIAAQDLDRNALGFDLQKNYIDLCANRLMTNTRIIFDWLANPLFRMIARNIPQYIAPETPQF